MVSVFCAKLIAPQYADVAQARKTPLLRRGRTAGIVDMAARTAGGGYRRGDTPALVYRIVQRRYPVAVDGFYFIMILRDLADGNLVSTGQWLFLPDEFITQIQAQAGLDGNTLHIPVGVDQAKFRAAGRLRRVMHKQRIRRAEGQGG